VRNAFPHRGNHSLRIYPCSLPHRMSRNLLTTQRHDEEKPVMKQTHWRAVRCRCGSCRRIANSALSITDPTEHRQALPANGPRYEEGEWAPALPAARIDKDDADGWRLARINQRD